MNSKIYPIMSIFAAAVLGGCVNVDSETAKTPSVYWKAPEGAMPSEYYTPEQIKTDKIVSEKDKNNVEKATAAASETSDCAGAGKKSSAESQKSKVALSASEKMLAGMKLSLPELIDVALENNTTTRTYWFQAKSYAAQHGKANAAYYPQVSVGMQVYRDKTKASLGYNLPLPIGAYYETAYGPSAQINWLLFDFGKRESQIESAREAMRAANFEYNQSVQDVFLNVNVAYFNYYAAVAGVKAAQLNLQDCQTSYDSADRKLKDGVGNRQDMLNALASLKDAEFELENKKSDVESARATLANALGVSAASIQNISDEIQVPSSAETSKKIDELIATALKSRQSLLAGYAQLRKTHRDVQTAKRDFLPEISAVGSANYMWYTARERDDAYQYQFGLSASWSIFEGFARKYELISAKSLERAQAQQLKAEQIKIITNIWAYYHVYQSSLKQIASAAATVKASEEAYEATRIGFNSGVNTITDLLNAQTRLASARQTNVGASATLATSIARLSHAVGAIGSKIPAENGK